MTIRDRFIEKIENVIDYRHKSLATLYTKQLADRILSLELDDRYKLEIVDMEANTGLGEWANEGLKQAGWRQVVE